MGVCDVLHKYFWSLPAASTSSSSPTPSPSGDSTTPCSSTLSPRPSLPPPSHASPVKQSRRPARPKTSCGLQPFTLSRLREDGSGERDFIYFWALPSPSGLVVRYQVSHTFLLCGSCRPVPHRMKLTPFFTPHSSPTRSSSSPSSRLSLNSSKSLLRPPSRFHRRLPPLLLPLRPLLSRQPLPRRLSTTPSNRSRSAWLSNGRYLGLRRRSEV